MSMMLLVVQSGYIEMTPNAERRFPPRRSIEDTGAAFVVKDGSDQKLGYFYYEEEAGRRSTVKMVTKDEARRIAAGSGLAGNNFLTMRPPNRGGPPSNAEQADVRKKRFSKQPQPRSRSGPQ
jgi:hypothetical protein